MAIFKPIDFRGDLFATTFSFSAQALIRLFSSIVLTRILRPESYGVITLLLSIVFVVELLADINVSLFIVREQEADQARFINTAWTMRLGRAVLNTLVVFLGAPIIADTFYKAPELVLPLRVFAVSFLIGGFESMAFALAMRRKRTRILMYSELFATCVSTTFSIVYCLFSRDYWGLIYGILLNRLVITIVSYRFYPELRPRLQFQPDAARSILKFTKYTMPSSLLTIAMTQFDKVVFLRLFDMRLLGIYGLAGNIAGPIESLISRISNQVLYPRCAHNFREDPGSARWKYYQENVRLFVSILIMPAVIGGGARLVISLLYDPRYAQAAAVLQAFMVRSMLLSLATPAEDLMIASGASQVILVGNVYRAAWMFTVSLLGYWLFGFMGFAYGAALSPLVPLGYYWWLQRKSGLLIAKFELWKVAFAAGMTVVSYTICSLILRLWPALRLGFRH